MRRFKVADVSNIAMRGAGTSVPIFGLRDSKTLTFFISSFMICLSLAPFDGTCVPQDINAIPVHAYVYRSEAG
jgi:hypothetical protein